jgi:hypothetical protein
LIYLFGIFPCGGRVVLLKAYFLSSFFISFSFSWIYDFFLETFVINLLVWGGIFGGAFKILMKSLSNVREAFENVDLL